MLKAGDARSLSADAQEALRRRAVQAVLRGMTQADAAKAFGVTRRAVSGWMRVYRKGGMASLAAQRQGRPRGGRLLS